MSLRIIAIELERAIIRLDCLIRLGRLTTSKNLAVEFVQDRIIRFQRKGLLEHHKGRLNAPAVQVILGLAQPPSRRATETTSARWSWTGDRLIRRQSLRAARQRRRRERRWLRGRRRQIDDSAFHLSRALPARRKLTRERPGDHLLKGRGNIRAQHAHWREIEDRGLIIRCIVVCQYAMQGRAQRIEIAAWLWRAMQLLWR